MKLLCWNIQHGGGARRARIVEEITAYDPDVIALTSFRAKPGEALRNDLRERGWDFCEATAPAANRNGIAVFSRNAMRRTRPCPAPPGESARWLDIDFPEFGFGMGVLHIMAGGSARNSPATVAKVRFWDAVVEAARTRLHEPFLLVGDWNTGLHRLDETGSSFVCHGHFAKLSAMGWTDLWRHRHPGTTEFTWYWTVRGVRGNGFRVDHAFVTPSLLARVNGCRYSHAERDAGISDHSLVIVEIE
jgi:exodeoxyribonuclease III